MEDIYPPPATELLQQAMPPDEPKQFIRIKRLLPVLVSALLLTGTLVAITILSQKRNNQPQQAAAPEKAQTQPLAALLTITPTEIPTEKQQTDLRAVFGIVEGLKMNIYAVSLDGVNRKVLLSQEISEPNTRARPFTVVDAKVSPDRSLIAYKFPQSVQHTVSAAAAVYLMDRDGKQAKTWIDEAETFFWGKDNQTIVYSLPNPKNNNPALGVGGMPFRSPGVRWRMTNVQTGEVSPVIPDDMEPGFSGFSGWIDSSTMVFSSQTVYGPELYLIDERTNNKKQVPLPEETQLGEISTSLQKKRTVVSILPRHYGANYSCDMQEITANGLQGNPFISDINYQCGDIRWNGDDEFYYGKGTGPNGHISTSDTSESGYYVLLSVYKYNFVQKKDTPVLVSDGKEVYRFFDVLPGHGIVVSNESARRSPAYSIELRDLDGKNPVVLATSEKEMLFIGWVE